MVGTNVSLPLAKAAKALAAKGPLADKDLRTLRAQALRGDETLNPDERIFLTALTEESNAKLLAAARLADGVKLRFGFAPGATTRRIADLDRPVPDADVLRQCLLEALDELKDSASDTRPRAPRGRKGAAAKEKT